MTAGEQNGTAIERQNDGAAYRYASLQIALFYKLC